MFVSANIKASNLLSIRPLDADEILVLNVANLIQSVRPSDIHKTIAPHLPITIYRVRGANKRLQLLGLICCKYITITGQFYLSAAAGMASALSLVA